MDSSQLWHFFGVRNDLRGELNSPVVEWLNKGLISASSPNDCSLLGLGYTGRPRRSRGTNSGTSLLYQEKSLICIPTTRMKVNVSTSNIAVVPTQTFVTTQLRFGVTRGEP
eukprot:1060355-Prorocentrum_minimum.AAC.3